MREVIVGIACLALTVVAYGAGLALQRASRSHPLVNPTLVGIVLTAVVLIAASVPFADYVWATTPLRMALGPATVALAIPLYRNLGRIRRAGPAVVLAFLAGSAAATVAGAVAAGLCGAGPILARALLTKSVTAAAAVGIAGQIGSDPNLAAALSIVTGIVAAPIVGFALRGRLERSVREMRGFAIGIVGHGIGTANALRVDADAGAFATVGMGANAVLSALLIPLVAAFVH